MVVRKVVWQLEEYMCVRKDVWQVEFVCVRKVV